MVNEEQMENKPILQEQDTKLKSPQRSLVIILLVLVILLLGGLIYFLIRDDILDLSFLNAQSESEKIVQEETEDKEGLEEELFFVSYDESSDSAKYSFSAEIPKPAAISGEDTTTTNIIPYLKVSISHIAVPETVKSYVDLGNGLYRVVDDSDHIYYTNDFNTEDNCVQVGATAPCGSLSVELSNDSDETVYIIVEFVGDEEDLSTADEIVSSFKFINEV